MRFVVCIKQVPDPSQARIDERTGTVVREGVAKMVNPFDVYAVEEALRLREKVGGEVIALSMGPWDAADALREAIAMGADDAVLLSDRAFAGSDTLATSYALSRAIERIGGVDLVLCGRQAIDGDTAQVGPELAEHLGIPHTTQVRRVAEISPEAITVERLTDKGYDLIEMALPALITVVKEINEPRLPSLKGLMRAKKTEIKVWGPQDIDADPLRIGSSGSPTRVFRTFEPQRRYECEMLSGSVEQQVEALFERLQNRGISLMSVRR